jgi:hypothetical protein
LGNIGEFLATRDETQALMDATQQLHDGALQASASANSAKDTAQQASASANSAKDTAQQASASANSAMQRALQSSSSAASYAEEALQHSTTAGQHKDTASAKAQEAAEGALAADASARASAESSEKALQYRDEAQALAAAATLAEEAATGALGMVATHLSATQDAAGQAAEDRALAESAKADALSASADAESAAQQAQQAREQSQAIYEGLIAVNTFMVGHAYNYGVTLEGTRVGICWTDPNDLVTQDLATIARWGKTRLLYKAGGFPEHEEDGVVLVDSVARDQYRETPFTHDFGSSGDYYFALFTCTTGGVWNTTDTAPRFTTDDLTWATIAMMTRTDTLLQYPGMEIGAVVDIQVSTMFPKLRYKLAHVNYDGGHARVRDFHYDHTKLFNSIWIPHLLPCLGDSNAALMLPFDAKEREYGRTWDEVFVTGKKYYKIVDFEYVELAEGTDYEPGGSVQEWAAAVGYDAYTKNHAQRTSTGSNSWKDSNMRQWLNSSGTGWFRQQNEYDVNGITQAGFLTGFDQDLLDLVQPVYNITARNTASALIGGGGGGFDTTLDRVWLPSRKEVFNSTNNYIAEGAQFSYFSDVANTDALRIQRDEGGTARGAWMRSPDASSYVHYANALNSSGGIGQWTSVNNTGQAFLPTLCIA